MESIQDFSSLDRKSAEVTGFERKLSFLGREKGSSDAVCQFFCCCKNYLLGYDPNSCPFAFNVRSGKGMMNTASTQKE